MRIDARVSFDCLEARARSHEVDRVVGEGRSREGRSRATRAEKHRGRSSRIRAIFAERSDDLSSIASSNVLTIVTHRLRLRSR